MRAPAGSSPSVNRSMAGEQAGSPCVRRRYLCGMRHRAGLTRHTGADNARDLERFRSRFPLRDARQPARNAA